MYYPSLFKNSNFNPHNYCDPKWKINTLAIFSKIPIIIIITIWFKAITATLRWTAFSGITTPLANWSAEEPWPTTNRENNWTHPVESVDTAPPSGITKSA